MLPYSKTKTYSPVKNKFNRKNLVNCDRLMPYGYSKRLFLTDEENTRGGNYAKMLRAELIDDTSPVFNQETGQIEIDDNQRILKYQQKTNTRSKPFPEVHIKSPERVPERISPRSVFSIENTSDNYYSNLLAWGKDDNFAVASKSAVYFGKSTNFKNKKQQNLVETRYEPSALEFIDKSHLLVALADTGVYCIDINKSAKAFSPVNAFDDFNLNFVTLKAIDNNCFLVGCSESFVYLMDLREKRKAHCLYKHDADVCNIDYLNFCAVSGGNDNNVLLFELRARKALFRYSHLSAIKGVAMRDRWLVSGGGTLDKKIKIHHLANLKLVKEIKVDSQVTGIKFVSPDHFVVSKGYVENNFELYSTKEMEKVAVSRCFTKRILHLATKEHEAVTLTSNGNLAWWDFSQYTDEEGKYALEFR